MHTAKKTCVLIGREKFHTDHVLPESSTAYESWVLDSNGSSTGSTGAFALLRESGLAAKAVAAGATTEIYTRTYTLSLHDALPI